MLKLPPFRRFIPRRVPGTNRPPFHSTTHGRQSIALLLVYALLVQCVPMFSRVADAIARGSGSGPHCDAG